MSAALSLALLFVSCAALGALLERAIAWLAKGTHHHPSPAALLWWMLSGAIMLASGRALFATQGRTLLLWLALLWLALLWRRATRPPHPPAPGPSLAWLSAAVLGLGLGLLALQHWRLYPLGSDLPRPLYVDEFTYTKASYRLAATGLENNLPAALYWDSEITGTSPYHYLDLWLQALIAEGTGSWVEARALLVIPFFWTLSFLGGWQLALPGRSPARAALLALFVLGLGGVSLVGNEGIGGYFAGVQGLAYTPLLAEKLAMFAPFLWLAYLAARRGAREEAIGVLLALPLVAISTLPMVVGGVGLFSLVQVWRGPSRKIFFGYGLLAAAVLLVVAGFYALTGEALESLARYVWQPGFSWSQRLKPALLYLVQRGIVLAPWMLLALWHWRALREALRLHREPLGLAAALLGCGLVVWLVFASFYDAHQFFDNVEITLVGILLFDLWQHGMRGGARLAWAALGLASVLVTGRALSSQLSAPPREDPNYVARLRALASRLPPGTRGGSLLGGISRSALGGNFPENELLGGTLLFTAPHLQPTNLAIPEMEEQFFATDANFRALIRQTPMYRYLAAHPAPGASAEEKRWRFARAMQLRYLFLSPGATLDPRLAARAEEVLTDPRTGERFVLLSPWD